MECKGAPEGSEVPEFSNSVKCAPLPSHPRRLRLLVVRRWGSTAACESQCGNGVIDEGESCDGDALGGMTCLDLGDADGELQFGLHARHRALHHRPPRCTGHLRDHVHAAGNAAAADGRVAGAPQHEPRPRPLPPRLRAPWHHAARARPTPGSRHPRRGLRHPRLRHPPRRATPRAPLEPPAHREAARRSRYSSDSARKAFIVAHDRRSASAL